MCWCNRNYILPRDNWCVSHKLLAMEAEMQGGNKNITPVEEEIWLTRKTIERGSPVCNRLRHCTRFSFNRMLTTCIHKETYQKVVLLAYSERIVTKWLSVLHQTERNRSIPLISFLSVVRAAVVSFLFASCQHVLRRLCEELTRPPSRAHRKPFRSSQIAAPSWKTLFVC